MNTLLKSIKAILMEHKFLRRYRRALSGMMAVVVFVTSYALMMNAIALDADTAQDEPGMVMEETVAEAAEEDVDVSEPEEEPPAEPESEEQEEQEDAEAAETGSEDAEDAEDAAEPEAGEQLADTDSESGSEETAAGTTEEAGAAVAPAAADGTVAVELITEPTELTFKGSDYTVTAAFDGGAQFPVGIKLVVEEIRQNVKEEEEDYQVYYDTALEQIQEKQGDQKAISYARFFDISFVKDGVIYEPKAPVNVKITFDELEREDDRRPEEDADVSVLHFDREFDTAKDNENTDKVEEMEVDVTEQREAVDITFDSKQFSVYGVVYTIHFEYEVDGKTYTSASMPGAEYMPLAEVIRGLSIVSEGEVDTFVSKIDKVTSTNEDVAVVETVGGVLNVRVLRDGDAQIVITMQDGSTFRVDVVADGETAAGNETATVSTVGDLYLPADAKLEAKALNEEQSESAIAAVQAAEENTDSSAAETAYQVFDISLENVEADQYDGFQVEVKLPERLVGRDFRLFHIHDGVVEELEIEKEGYSVSGGTEQISKVSFVTDSFSEFVLKYTVDFEYEANDVTSYYSIEGGSTISLIDLLSYLGINISTDYIRDVAVSNSRLISVTFEGGQWMLTSLMPFTSEETLTISLVDGSTITIKITDDQPIDLTNTITNVKVTIDGEEVPDGSQVVEGRLYDVTIRFEETDDVQFSNDDTDMYYTFPAGVTIPDSSGTFEMDFGGLGKLKNNTYTVENGVLHVHWNTSDTVMMNILRAADRAHFDITLATLFDRNAEEIHWNQDVNTHVDVEDPHEVSVSKTGTYDPDNEEIHYIVTITSEGSTTGIKVTDAITGTALTSKVQNVNDITVTRKRNGTTETVTPTGFEKKGNGFVLNLPNMSDGDIYYVEYNASVNYEALGQSGKTTYLEANNGVMVEWDEGPGPKEDNSYEYEINYSSLNKIATIVSEIETGADGKKYRTITWEIEANKERKVPVTYITDSIRADSRNLMKMDGTGVTITVTKENGEQVTRILSWGDNDEINGMLTKSDDYTWTYNPPLSDDVASYKITYQTKAEVTEQAYVANNDVTDDHDTSSTGVPVADVDALVKSVTSVSEEETNWAIDLTVPTNGTTNTRLIEELPYYIAGSYHFFDLYDSCTVTGLIEGEEGYDILYEHRKYSSQWNYVSEINSDPTPPEGYITAQVFIDFYHMVNNEKVPGLIATGAERNIHVEITTKNNEEWLKAAAEADSSTAYWNLRPHINRAHFGNLDALAEAHPAVKKIEKDYKNTGTVKLDDGNTYSYYQYTLTLTDVKDGRNQIFDTFDTDVFEVLDLDHLDPTEYQNNNPFTPDKDNGHGRVDDGNDAFTFVKSDSHTATFTPTDTGVVISTNGLDKNEQTGEMYDCYKITYYLVLKNPELAKQKAFEAGGKIKFTNRVNWDGAKSEADIEYGTPILDKNAEIDLENHTVWFTIEINPDKMEIGVPDEQGNYPEKMKMTDTFSNALSIDYSSITITTDPAPDVTDSTVTYDYSGNTGTFYIPNKTHVIIKYKCRIIATGTNVQIYNKAILDGKYEDFTEEYKVVSSDMSGGAQIIYLNLLKYASDHMEQGSLAGATFRLLDSEKNPVRYTARVQNPASVDLIGEQITFTTESETPENKGLLWILLSQYDHGITLKRNTVYYLEEIEPPTGMQLDPTLYSFVISDDPTHANYYREDGVYVYYEGDILKIRNNPETLQLQITKRFAGNVELTQEQKEKIHFNVQRVDENGNVITGDGAFEKDISYSEMKYDKYSLKEEDGLIPGFYKVTEYHDDMGLDDNVVSTTTYTVNTDGSTETGSSLVVDLAEVKDEKTTNIIFTNKYTTGAYYFTKLEAGTEQPVAGAEFSVFKYNDDDIAASIYTTGEDGKFMITRETPDHSLLDPDTLYYVKETKAAEGYVLPEDAPEYYFYFGSEGAEAPAGAVENNAINLSSADPESAHQTVLNTPETSIMVKKEWKYADGTPLPEEEKTSINVTLRRYVEKTIPQDAATVTVNVKFGEVINETKSFSDVKIGSHFTISIDGLPWAIQLSYQGNNVLNNGQGSISLDEITGDTTIELTKTSQWEPVIPRMSFDYEEAGSISQTDYSDPYANTQILSTQNDWYYLWDKLDKESDAGEPYYYYIEEDTEIPGFTVTYDNNGGIQTGIITVTNTKQEEDKGDLEVSKEVLSDVTAHLTQDFTFTVSLNDTTINDTYGDMIFENGVATFTLKHNEKKTAIGLPLGITYIVTEEDAEGFELTGKTGDTGIISRTLSKAKFENTPVGSLEITKEIHTNGVIDSTKTGDFSFAVYNADDVENGIPKEGKTAKATGQINVTDTGTKTVTVSDLPYGTYYVYELDVDNNPIVSGEIGALVLIDGISYTAIGSGVEVTVGAEGSGNATGTSALNETTLINEVTDFEFTKIWNNASQTAVEWPDGKEIKVTVSRKIGPSGNPQSIGEYTIKRNGSDFSITSVPETAPNLVKKTETAGTNDYIFQIQNLPKIGTIGSETGVYTYFVTETAMDDYNASYRISSASGTILTVEYADNGGTIINTPVDGYQLPESGGIGTTIFTALGSLIIFMAGAMLIIMKFRGKGKRIV